MKVLYITFVVVLISVNSVFAERTAGKHIACISEEKLDEFVQAQVRNDIDGMKYLVNKNHCIIPKAGLKLSVLKRSWTISKVRIYVGDNAVVLWTPNENIVD